MIAIKRLQSIMWILFVAVGALSAYLVSLRVATERNAVVALEHKIYSTRAQIRYLEVEFSSRSTMRQLAAWNAQDIKYSVPKPDQYLSSEQQLASLDVGDPKVAPTYAAPPVMAAMAQAEPASAMIVPVKAEVQPAALSDRKRNADAGLALVRSAEAAEPLRPRPAVIAKTKPDIAPRIVNLVDKAPVTDRRAMRLALLEQTLLGAKPTGHVGKADAGKAAR